MRLLFLLLFLVNFALFTAMGTYLAHDAAGRADSRREIAVSAGYGQLPAPASLSWPKAMAAGLFYGVSLGIGISVLEAAAALLLTRMVANPSTAAVLFGLASAGTVYQISGFSKAAVFFCFSFGFATFLTASAFHALKRKLPGRLWARAVLIAVLIAAAGYWLGVRDFTGIRNQLLLPNGPGRAVSDFYYENTVNAARPVESLAQRSWLLAGADRDSFTVAQWRELENRLLKDAVFLVPRSAVKEKDVFDVAAENRDGKVLLDCGSNKGDAVVLSADTAGDLEKLSKGCDPARNLRSLLALCVGLACPAAVLLTAAWAAGWCWERIAGRLSPRGRITVAAIGVACIGVVLVMGAGGPLPKTEPALLETALHGNVFERGRAAREIFIRSKNGMDREILLKMAASGDPRLRIYAARGLAFAWGPDVLRTLTGLSRDRRITVASSAVYGLSHQPGRTAQKRLVELCAGDSRPYVAFKAFNALKSRGWLEKKP